MKRILLTGGTGFVGANLAERLVEEGHEVCLLVRDGYKPWRIERLLRHVRILRSDLLNRESLATDVRRIKPDWVFHLAAYGAYSWQDELDLAVKTNFLGTVNLVESCREVGFEAFIHSGSSSEYGVKENAAREDDLPEPNSYYAVTKASATLFCRYSAQRFNLPIYTLRLYSAYGPYEEPGRLIPNLIINGLSGKFPPLAHPDIARDFIHVEDVCNACLFLADSARSLASGEIYNAGIGRQTTLREVVKITQEIFGIQAAPVWGSMENRAWDTTTWVANNEKLCNAGWKPLYDFRAGYSKTIEWFKANPSLLEKIYSRY